jgi:hypothetical protein
MMCFCCQQSGKRLAVQQYRKRNIGDTEIDLTQVTTRSFSIIVGGLHSLASYMLCKLLCHTSRDLRLLKLVLDLVAAFEWGNLVTQCSKFVRHMHSLVEQRGPGIWSTRC